MSYRVSSNIIVITVLILHLQSDKSKHVVNITQFFDYVFYYSTGIKSTALCLSYRLQLLFKKYF